MRRIRRKVEQTTQIKRFSHAAIKEIKLTLQQNLLKLALYFQLFRKVSNFFIQEFAISQLFVFLPTTKFHHKKSPLFLSSTTNSELWKIAQ